MKFRIGFVSNSSASSFLVMDKTLDLEAVKKRFAKEFGHWIVESSFCSFEVIDEKFMSDPYNDHLDLPFLRHMLSELDSEYDRKREKLNKLFDYEIGNCKNLNQISLERLYYEKKQQIVDKYIQKDAFRKKYKGMIYFYKYGCFEEEALDEKLGDIGRYIAVDEPYGVPNGFGEEPDDEDDCL